MYDLKEVDDACSASLSSCDSVGGLGHDGRGRSQLRADARLRSHVSNIVTLLV